MPQKPLLAFIGGFLGAGKTTLILKAAELLKARGLRSAAIMNDQDAELVDTQLAMAHNLATREVSGGCFCCRFSRLMEAADQLSNYAPDVIFAEPVGSCIDLSATILQPLKATHDQTYRLAPLTVLLDPGMAQRDQAPDVDYLFRNQLAEADLICVTKRDLYPALPDLPFPIDFHLSAKTGQGVEAWIQEILASNRTVGARLLDVDYKRYAAAEAALGWLNLHASVHLSQPASPSTFAGLLLDELASALAQADIPIAHLKVFDRAPSGWISATISQNQEPEPAGHLLADPAQGHELAINLRAVADPASLQKIVDSVLAEVAGTVEIRHFGAFRPAEPKPEFRFFAKISGTD